MKSWRTITAAAVVALTPATAVFALGNCGPDLQLKQVCGLTLCIERTNNTSAGVGNIYPWTSDTFFFARTRVQYLYPSSAVAKAGAIAQTIETISARGVSFIGASVSNYTGDSRINISRPPASTLVTTFALNPPGPSQLDLKASALGGTIVLGTSPGYNNPAVILSDFSNRPGADLKTRTGIGVVSTKAPVPNLMVDEMIFIGGGNSGFGVWDLTSGACGEPKRAYGSGTFANMNALTTALAVDNMAFVWVFCGLALPPPATVQQQISEIIRLLLTPESLRCSFGDQSNDDVLDDIAYAYPDGKDFDPIAPRVTSGGTITGDEGGAKSKRAQGW